MEIILIDDEILEMENLTNLLGEMDNINLVKNFTNPMKALAVIERLNPDIIFLNVEITGINGFKLTERIQEIIPHTPICFVANNSNHAIMAFELNVFDYIMTPVQPKRLVKTFQRLSNSVKREITPKVIMPMVCTFGTLHFTYDNNPFELINVKWRTANARSIFIYLLHYRNQYVRKDMLIDEFWSEGDLKYGSTQLYTAIYSIRKTLESIGFPITIESSGHNYRLKLNGVKVDVEEWEKGMSLLATPTDDTYREFQKILNLYKGSYFWEEEFTWIKSEQQRLRMIWLSQIKKMTNYLYNKGEYLEAIILYLQVLKVDPLTEDTYFMLMQLYNKVGERFLVKKKYTNLKRMLKEEYGMEPNGAVQNWYNEWRKVELVSI